MSAKAAFEDIYREYFPKVLRYVSRIAGPQEAEDITQEVFIKANKALEDFRGDAKLSTWLYRIATNAALDRLKSSSARHSGDRVDVREIEASEDRDVWSGQKKDKPDQSAIRKEMGECIKEYVEGLPADYRAVLALSELEELKNAEIAEILEISVNNVKIRLHRARAALRKELEKGCDLYHSEQDVLSCDRKSPQKKSS